ncbi:TetR/AcrR family transcriptional regulator [Herbiconiux sp. UC225_62]|uniref:TetR/AcrR family transcriptional regulator n=1 Tax=Herbiconiux sp. UC225_62 TaxID=3350168 RepID=UPI0036D32554
MQRTNTAIRSTERANLLMGARPISSDPRSQKSRQQILDALHAQARAGELTSISSLSEAAGVTRATFYNHFDIFEEAAWFAILDSFDHLIARAFEKRDEGIQLRVAAIENLRLIVELLRAEPQLFHLADTYDNGSDLRGIGEIFRVQTRLVWKDSGNVSATAEVEITYAAAGLYAVLSTGARGNEDADEIARVAHSLLPEWMRQPNRT